MLLKNYYTILGVPPDAAVDEIRNAFRQLAKKYHPDKAPDNPFAATHFGEIQEAYEILAHPARRKTYDEERWLRGLGGRAKKTVRITPEWIMGEAGRLRRHMATADTYRMNHRALRDYILALLSPEHLSILQDAPDLRSAIIEEIFTSTARLRHQYTHDIEQQLILLADGRAEGVQRVRQWADTRAREAKWNYYRPFIVLAFALLICVLIWALK